MAGYVVYGRVRGTHCPELLPKQPVLPETRDSRFRFRSLGTVLFCLSVGHRSPCGGGFQLVFRPGIPGRHPAQQAHCRTFPHCCVSGRTGRKHPVRPAALPLLCVICLRDRHPFDGRISSRYGNHTAAPIGKPVDGGGILLPLYPDRNALRQPHRRHCDGFIGHLGAAGPGHPFGGTAPGTGMAQHGVRCG